MWCRVTMKIASSELSVSTASALVDMLANPNRRWALAADSDRLVATWASRTVSSLARWGSSIDEA